MSEKPGEKRENFASIRQRLLRHLSVNNNVTALSKSFGGIQENFKRVDFVLELFQKSNVNIEFIKNCKNDEIATKLREQGNEMYKIKRLKEAWEFYTKSISFAEENTVNLALAYANRSAVLFEVNLHKQCLMDIGRALENNYPEHLKSKLFVREKNSKNLEIEAFRDPHELIPTIENKNPKILCASDCLDIQENEEMGRYVIATRDIKPGEILAVEKSFTSLLVKQYLNHCHECINLCYNLIPCKNCTQVLYCSNSCRERAFESYHKYECPILLTLNSLELDKLKLFPLKIAFIIRNQFNEIKHFENDNIYKSDRYKEIHSLVTNCEKRSVPDLFERATAAAVIVTLVKDHTNFFEELSEESVKTFKEVLLLHMQTGPSNFHEVTELAPNSKGVYEPEEVASGAFAFLSLLNHSCCPNVTRFCYGSVIVLRAIQSIKKGEQCFDNYGYHHAITGKSVRQKHLRDQYYFDCTCKACENNWPLYDALPVVNKVEVEESLLEKLSFAEVEVAEAALEDLLSKLYELEEFMPCKNFCQVQEIVKQCFAVFGSKRRIF